MSTTLKPTFEGHVKTTQDARILFEACLTGRLSLISRRPKAKEIKTLIRSGCVFIYDETISGIRRWRDGVKWSPSRGVDGFFIYRELDKPLPSGKKRKAKKNGKPIPTEVDRSLIGSQIDSYGFKDDGLVKKTMRVIVGDLILHLVSYYKLQDVKGDELLTPSQIESLQHVRPREGLIPQQAPSQAQYEYQPTMMESHPMAPNNYYVHGPPYTPFGSPPDGPGRPAHNYLPHPSQKPVEYDPLPTVSTRLGHD